LFRNRKESAPWMHSSRKSRGMSNRSHALPLLTPFVGNRPCERLDIPVPVRRGKSTLWKGFSTSPVAHGRSVTALAGLCSCAFMNRCSQSIPCSLRGSEWEQGPRRPRGKHHTEAYLLAFRTQCFPRRPIFSSPICLPTSRSNPWASSLRAMDPLAL
jgi:hypothetical protein